MRLLGRRTSEAFGSPSQRVMAVAARAFTKSATVYTFGSAVVVPFGIISLAITTRFLGLDDYGRLSTLFAIASILTVLAGIGVLQGVLMGVYGAADDDADVDGDDLGDLGGTAITIEGARPEVVAAERRRMLGSGVLLIFLASTAWCGLAAILSPIIAQVFLGSTSWTSSVLWMTLVAWTGSTWRFAHQIWRLERRSVTWSMFQVLRLVCTLAGTAAGLVLGFGINGVLAGTAAGTLLATVISGVASRRSFLIRPRRGDSMRIIRLGLRVAPIIVARVTQSNVAVILLSLAATSASVGLFQAASRVAQIPAFFASGFLTAWIPLTRSPIGAAGLELRGRAGFNARIFTLLMLTLIGMTATIALMSGVAIQIAAPSFSSAAGLIPVVALGLVAMESFHAYYRGSQFPGRRWWYTVLNFLWLGPYIGALAAAKALSPTYAVAVAQVIASAWTLACIVWLDKRGSDPLPVRWRRLGAIALVAAICVALAEASGASPEVRAALGVVALVAFPVILRVTGLLKSSDMRVIADLSSSMLTVRPGTATLRSRLGTLPSDEGAALTMIAWRQNSAKEVAMRYGVPEDLANARFVRGLRGFSGYPAARTPNDAAIGQYLLAARGAIETDLLAEQLGSSGVSLVELHELEEALRRARRLRRRGLRLVAEAPSIGATSGGSSDGARQREVPVLRSSL